MEHCAARLGLVAWLSSHTATCSLWDLLHPSVQPPRPPARVLSSRDGSQRSLRAPLRSGDTHSWRVLGATVAGFWLEMCGVALPRG